jgi:hypothetical protein
VQCGSALAKICDRAEKRCDKRKKTPHCQTANFAGVNPLKEEQAPPHPLLGAVSNPLSPRNALQSI